MMKITDKPATVYQIDDVPDLDPVTVFLQDTAPGAGRLTVECFGHAWSVWWGGMGNRLVSEFIVAADESYIAGKLVSGLQRTVGEREKHWMLLIARAVLAAERERRKT